MNNLICLNLASFSNNHLYTQMAASEIIGESYILVHNTQVPLPGPAFTYRCWLFKNMESNL